MTKAELEHVERHIYNCKTCPYPSYRDSDRIFCGCCWAKYADKDYRKKVDQTYKKMFGGKNSDEKLAEMKISSVKIHLERNKDGYYTKKRRR